MSANNLMQKLKPQLNDSDLQKEFLKTHEVKSNLTLLRSYNDWSLNDPSIFAANIEQIRYGIQQSDSSDLSYSYSTKQHKLIKFESIVNTIIKLPHFKTYNEEIELILTTYDLVKNDRSKTVKASETTPDMDVEIIKTKLDNLLLIGLVGYTEIGNDLLINLTDLGFEVAEELSHKFR